MRIGRHGRTARGSAPAIAARSLIGGTAVALALGVAPAAEAAPAPDIVPSGPDASQKPAGSGGRSGSFNSDNADDILARSASTGDLRVYPHSGSYQGTATFQAAQKILGDTRGFRWIGQGDFNGDDYADVAGITKADGRLLIALNAGGLNGEHTLQTGYTSSYGWNSTDLAFTGDVNGDGADDMLARRKGTNSTYAYLNKGADRPAFGAPLLLAQTGAGVVDQKLADVTGDGTPDLLSLKSNGELHMRDYKVNAPQGQSYLIGTGYNSNTALVVNDYNVDEKADLLGRTGNGTLRGYLNSGSWNPGNPRAIFGSPVPIGHGWNANDIIS
jgi:hypothetical protein